MQKKSFDEAENAIWVDGRSPLKKILGRLHNNAKSSGYSNKPYTRRFNISTFFWSIAELFASAYMDFEAWKYYLSKYPTSEVYFDRIYTNIKIEIGNNSSSAGPIHIFSPLHLYDYNVKIGSQSQIGKNLEIIISKRHTPECVSNDVNALLSTFDSRKLYHSKYFETYGDVSVGNDVWIGNDVTILGGVNIGDGAIIGTKSFINKDVEPFSVVAGIPGKKIRSRFTQEQIAALEKIKYWNFDKKAIENNLELFYDVDKFIKMFESEWK